MASLKVNGIAATVSSAAVGLMMFVLPLTSLAGDQSDTAKDQAKRTNYHTPPDWALPGFQEQHKYALISPLLDKDGKKIESPKDWYDQRRPELLRDWTKILGKLAPAEKDKKWFGDISKIVIHETEEAEGYTRIHLSIPIETDFLQPHLLLIPKDQGKGPFPAVIAWTSTSPDYKKPEEWWGSWLAKRGFVVLTGWSFIRNYRGGINYRNNINEAAYKRFGHWLPMAKMVHDVQREVEFLKTRPEVDIKRLGFMGFSLSAKAAVYVGAFAPDIKTTVAVDPHIAMHGDTNWEDPWYLDWRHKFPSIKTDGYPIKELRGTVWSLLDAIPSRPGFERNHHELLAMCAPRAMLVIGCSDHEESARHSDDRQSWAYFNRAKEVYRFLGVRNRFVVATTDEGHRATSPKIDPAWQNFFCKWLQQTPLEFDGYR